MKSLTCIFSPEWPHRLLALAFLVFAFHLSGAKMSAAVTSHRFHTSLTRMDLDAEKKLVEIEIRLFTHDLVPILEAKNKKPIDLEKTPGVDSMILDYLSQNFVLKDKNGDEKKLNWVGKEMDVDNAYIYVEIPISESLEDYSLLNTIFFETFDEQSNRVNIHFDKKKTDLLFLAGDKFKVIKGKGTETEDTQVKAQKAG